MFLIQCILSHLQHNIIECMHGVYVLIKHSSLFSEVASSAFFRGKFSSKLATGGCSSHCSLLDSQALSSDCCQAQMPPIPLLPAKKPFSFGSTPAAVL